jgi:hypothetical protein
MIPGQTDAVIEKSVEVPAPAPEAEAPTEAKPDPAPEAPKPEDESPKPDAPKEPTVTKPRSIYDDLKDTRKERNAWQDTAVEALKAQGIDLKGDETPEQVRELLKQHKVTPPAPETNPTPEKPPEPSKPADTIEAFAKEKGYDAGELAQLRDLFLKDVPQSELSAQERQQLAELMQYKQEQDAKEQRRTEDEAIQAQSPAVAMQMKDLGFEIHDPAELPKVMAEITRLAHTKAYADKEVDYIVFKERAALSKLVSPKKPSFETGSSTPAPEAPPELDLSSGKVTPEQAQQAVRVSGSRTSLEVRKAK